MPLELRDVVPENLYYKPGALLGEASQRVSEHTECGLLLLSVGRHFSLEVLPLSQDPSGKVNKNPRKGCFSRVRVTEETQG